MRSLVEKSLFNASKMMLEITANCFNERSSSDLKPDVFSESDKIGIDVFVAFVLRRVTPSIVAGWIKLKTGPAKQEQKERLQLTLFMKLLNCVRGRGVFLDFFCLT